MKAFPNKEHRMRSTVFDNYEMTMSFPTENGLPFIYTLESPTVIKLKAEYKKGGSAERSGILNMYFANKVQKRFGFLTPFEHQHYIAGIDNNRMLQVPLEYEIEHDVDQPHGFRWLKIRPNLPQTGLDSPVKLLKYSTVPFTSRIDILELQPVSLDKNTHLVLTSRKHKTTMERQAFSIQVEGDDRVIEEDDVKNNLAQLWLKSLQFNNHHYKKFEVLMNPAHIARSELKFNVAYDKMAVGGNNGVKEHQSHESEWQDVFPINHWQPNSEERRKEIMEGLSKGIESGDVHVWDISYNSPMVPEKQQVLTIGMVINNVNKKSKASLYWNSQTAEKEEPKYEACYIQELQISPNTPLDFEYMTKNAPKDQFSAELRYGKSCKGGTKVVIDAKATRSDQMKEAIEYSKTAKKCWEEIRKGNKGLWACQKANHLAQVRDQVDVLAEIPEFLKNIINQICNYCSHILPKSHVKVTKSGDSENAVLVRMTVLPFDVSTQQMGGVTVPRLLDTTLETQQLLHESNLFSNEGCKLRNFKKDIISLLILKVKVLKYIDSASCFN